MQRPGAFVCAFIVIVCVAIIAHFSEIYFSISTCRTVDDRPQLDTAEIQMAELSASLGEPVSDLDVLKLVDSINVIPYVERLDAVLLPGIAYLYPLAFMHQLYDNVCLSKGKLIDKHHFLDICIIVAAWSEIPFHVKTTFMIHRRIERELRARAHRVLDVSVVVISIFVLPPCVRIIEICDIRL